ncbi:MAG: hypothetical protein DHS80DRAFT_30432 [Piptocephalis tieghemiana]|nr:MAG: hypothetical protein DHS80DRAFT_30432 [Piptocephalis tieghemiana]
MKLTLSALSLLASLALLNPVSAWGGGGYGGGWGGNGWTSDGAPACTAGNIIAFSGYDGKFAGYGRDVTNPSTGELEVYPIHSGPDANSNARQWIVVSGGSKYPGKIGLQNVATKKFLGRCTGSTCKGFAKGDVAPLVIAEKGISDTTVWECNSISVDPSVHPSGVRSVLSGGDGLVLGFLNQDIVPATKYSGLQIGLINVNTVTKVDLRFLLEAKIVFDVNA